MDVKKAIMNAKEKLNRVTGNEEDRDRLEYSVLEVGARLYMQILILGLKRRGLKQRQITRFLNGNRIKCDEHTLGVWLAGKGGSPQIERIATLERLHNKEVKKKNKNAWRGR